MMTQTTVEIAQNKLDLSRWVPTYTSSIILIGAGILAYTLTIPKKDLLGLVLFAILAALSELTHVELFRNSHANVSVSMIVAIASVLVLGPFDVTLVQFVCGIATGLKILSWQKEKRNTKRTSWLRQSAFNVGMFVIAAYVSGTIYVFLGGTVGRLLFPSAIAPLFLTVSVYVLVNLTILMGVIVLQTGRRPIEIWGQDFSWSVPINILGGILGGGALAYAYESFSVFGLLVFFLPVLMTSYSFRLYANNMRGVVNRLEEMNRDLDESNVELLRTLGAVIDAYDAYTYGHSTQVAIYARTLGEKLGCSKSELDTLFRAGLIHDLGKIGITDTIIGKEGSLTEEEYNIVKRHTVIGAEIIGQMISLQDLVSLVKHHHERWDGSGYPDGLSGEKIPFGARILALADSLDAMFSERPYRKPLTLSQVETEVRRCSGFQFDPRVVDAFLIIALEKGSAFFKNSAVAVDQSIPDLVQEDFIHRLRYLKKSMISE